VNTPQSRKQTHHPGTLRIQKCGAKKNASKYKRVHENKKEFGREIEWAKAIFNTKENKQLATVNWLIYNLIYQAESSQY